MSKPCKVLTSSDSDEDDTCLREAAIEFNGNGGGAVASSHLSNHISKRIPYTAKGEANELNTTPEFRSFVSKKLSTYLDSAIECSEGNWKPVNFQEALEDGGFQLFSGSCGNWMTQDVIDCNMSQKRKKQIKQSSSDEDEKLAEAAVTKDFIFASFKESPNIESVTVKKHKKCKHKSKHKSKHKKCISSETEDLEDSKKNK